MAKKKAPTPAKKRNPQEMTPRNNNARKKEIEDLFARLTSLSIRVKALEDAKPTVTIEHTFPPDPRRT